MALADIRQRPGVLLGAAILLHVVLISAQVNTVSGLPVLQVVTFGSFAEVQRGTMAIVDGVRNFWSGYVDLRQVHVENDALKHELQTLQVRLQQEHAEAQRTDNLRQLLELRERANLDTTAADVIAAAASPEFRTVTIDKGANDGPAADMAVIPPAGVVGRGIPPAGAPPKRRRCWDRKKISGAPRGAPRARTTRGGPGRRLGGERGAVNSNGKPHAPGFASYSICPGGGGKHPPPGNESKLRRPNFSPLDVIHPAF